MEALLLPIGHLVGVSALGGRVRVGDQVVALPGPQLTLWSAVHRQSTVDQMTQAAASSAAVAMGLDEPQPILAELLHRGLLVEVSDPLQFAEAYRVTPLLLGLGNSASAPGTYAVGLPEEPAVALPVELCVLWEWSAHHSSVWETCRSVGAAAGRDPAALLDRLLEALPEWLEVQAVHLDRRSVMLG